MHTRCRHPTQPGDPRAELPSAWGCVPPWDRITQKSRDCKMGGRSLFAAAAILLALALLADAASAQDYIIRDGSGRRVGTVEQGIGVRLIHRDASGRRTGTIEPGIGNRLILRDARGRRTGTIEPGIGNRLIIRDRQGRRTGTVEDGIGGRLILRNSTGRRIGTVEPRW